MFEKIYFFVLSVLCLIVIFSFPVTAGQEFSKARIPEEVNEELGRLLTIADPDSNGAFYPEYIEKTFDFIMRPKQEKVIYYAEPKQIRGTSAYYEFDINTSLEHLLELAFNPDLPSFIILPAMVRYSRWIESGGMKKLSKALQDLKNPVMVSAAEYIENTPDFFSGAYYGYTLDRKLLLFKYKGNIVFLTISRQQNVSEVGRKGFKIGTNEDWRYIYSDQVGLTKTGLGWVRSYMYDSYTIAIYYTSEDQPFPIRCGIFKGLRAGWSRLNMVREKHIHHGLVYYAKHFKKILESDRLPSPSEITKSFSIIEKLDQEELRMRTKRLLMEICTKYSKDQSLARGVQKELSNIDQYLDKMKPYEMQAMLMIEYMKYVSNKNATCDPSFFTDLRLVKG